MNIGTIVLIFVALFFTASILTGIREENKYKNQEVEKDSYEYVYKMTQNNPEFVLNPEYLKDNKITQEEYLGICDDFEKFETDKAKRKLIK